MKVKVTYHNRMMVVAPELLQALEAIVEMFSKCDGDDCRCYEDSQRVAEQAIAKAKGLVRNE